MASDEQNEQITQLARKLKKLEEKQAELERNYRDLLNRFVNLPTQIQNGR